MSNVLRQTDAVLSSGVARATVTRMGRDIPARAAMRRDGGRLGTRRTPAHLGRRETGTERLVEDQRDDEDAVPPGWRIELPHETTNGRDELASRCLFSGKFDFSLEVRLTPPYEGSIVILKRR
ncbi:hypothetical protein CKO21_18935 [Rhodovibrio salinarum]|uniref:Uncharacterized protein n=1 Tax=Rhodovibrio salinarum TaxID=1087 RepID=A0A934V1D7_9PROT|nr:hypothetical protein [Rhodovibrio salinarum]